MIQAHTLGALDAAQTNAPLGHFEPLLRAHKTGIVTLNYDQLIEWRVRSSMSKSPQEPSCGMEASNGNSRQQPCLF